MKARKSKKGQTMVEYIIIVALIAISLIAVFMYFGRATGKKVVIQSVTGSKIFEVKGDLMTARRNILPEVSRELGRKVVDAVISAW